MPSSPETPRPGTRPVDGRPAAGPAQPESVATAAAQGAAVNATTIDGTAVTPARSASGGAADTPDTVDTPAVDMTQDVPVTVRPTAAPDDSRPVPVPVAAVPTVAGSRWFRRRPSAEQISLGVLIVVVLLALVGPLLSPYRTDVPSGEAGIAPFSPGHWLGTDNLGLDILTRILVGTRTSLFAALVVTGLSALAGLLLGAVAGFTGGWVDQVLMRITDLFLAFPATIVAMAIVAGLGPSLRSSMIGIMIVWWPMYARIARGEVRRAATGRHVETARIGGTRGWRLMLRHTVPTVLPTVLVTASLDIGGVIMVLASLAFVGLGSPSPAPELGLMASAGMPYLLNSWWIPVIPAVAVGVLTLVFTYLGDGLRSTLRSKGA